MKNRLILAFTLVTIFLSAHQSFACSCDGGWTFCNSTNFVKNDLIVSGEITYVDSTKLQLKIIDIFKGHAQTDTITIWAGTDILCSPTWFSMTTMDLGKKGDSIVIILPQIDSTNIENEWDVVGDYRRPNDVCITTWLRLRNGAVHGEIKSQWPMPNSTIYKASYSDFKALWANEKIDCSYLVGVDSNQNHPIDICMNERNLFVENLNNLNLNIEIFDHTGRRIHSLKSIADPQIAIESDFANKPFVIVQISTNNQIILNEKVMVN